MKAPLYNKLYQYAYEKYPFHMPGHKFGIGAKIQNVSIHLLDATEANGLDNLYEAQDILKEAMELMADFYGAKETLFITNGSTGGILASVLATCKPGDKMIVARNAHHSVWSALTLAGVEPIYITPNNVSDIDVMGSIRIEDIQQAIKQYPNVVGAIIVSPTYEGIVSDIESIAQYLHAQGKLLIVDEAHGAHFILGEEFPKGSIKSGADLVIQSMHKTLPTLTQSALLHIGSNRVSKESLWGALRMVQTSSPSYAMMGIMDYTRAYIQENIKSIRENYIVNLIEARNQLKALKYLYLVEVDDMSKMIISTSRANLNGYQLADLLEDQYKIGIEAALEKHIILISTFADTKERLEELVNFLLEIDSSLAQRSALEQINEGMELTQESTRIKQGISPRDIYFSNKEWISLLESEGRIVAKNIMIYPPGIPILCIGESVTHKDINILNKMSSKLLGIKEEENDIKIQVISKE